MSGTESARVEQCDRDRAAEIIRIREPDGVLAEMVLAGKADTSLTVILVASHRIAAIEATTEAAATWHEDQAAKILRTLEHIRSGMHGPNYRDDVADRQAEYHLAYAKALRANKHLEPRHD